MKSVCVVAGIMFGMTCMPVSAGLFSSCKGSDEPAPEWVTRPDFGMAGYYVGVGSAEQNSRSHEEQTTASEDNAKSNLVQRIEVTIKAENEKSTRVSGSKVVEDAQTKVIVSAEEVLRDLKVKARWVDDDTCRMYTLMIISQQSVAQAKREKTMMNRLARFKEVLAQAGDRNAHPSINIRKKFLEEAQSLLQETDFTVLPEELSKSVYEQRLLDVINQWRAESSQTVGRTAIYALNDNGIRPDVIGRLLDQMRAIDSKSERLMTSCITSEECLARARERGFSMLALFQVSNEVSTSQMGALKGTLFVTRTVYDIDTQRIVKGPEKVSSQVIGWSDEELDWVAAAEKAVQNLK